MAPGPAETPLEGPESDEEPPAWAVDLRRRLEAVEAWIRQQQDDLIVYGPRPQVEDRTARQ